MRLSKSPSLSLAHLLLSLTLIPLVQAQRKQCPKPVITYPIQGSTVNSRRVDIQGTTSLECLDLLIDIGHPYGPYQSARAAPDGTFTLPMSFDYGYNQYIQLEASNRTDTSYSSTYADGVEFTIDTVQPCLDSTIDYIPVVSWYGNQLYLTGEYLWYPTCDNITPFLNGVQWVDSTITASNGRWTILLDNVPDGRHTFTFASGTGEAHVLSRQSLGVEVFTGLCDPPTIETPSVGQIFNTRTPIFNGLRTTQQYAACNTVEYEIDGVYADRNQAGSTTWTLYIGEPGLAEGDHTLRVRHPGVASPPTGPWSAPVPFKIVLGSTPTQRPGDQLTRRTSCKVGEDKCVKTPTSEDRRTEICVPDLDTNIERCGACDGPDCTALPHVEGVACRFGICIVSSCEKGYSLHNNACVTSI